MLPGGTVAAAILLSLLPGWWFLRRTESARRPRQLSALQEVLELVGIGILTTGLAVSAGLLAWPKLLLDRELPTKTPADLRELVLVVLLALFAASALAEGAAWIVRKRDRAPESEFGVGVWWTVMRPDQVPEGQLPYAAIVLSDGTTVEGVLHDYTWSPEVAHRDIALRKPIKHTGVATKATPYDYLIVPGDQIRHLALKYTDR